MDRMKTENAIALYKCRLCGKTYDGYKGNMSRGGLGWRVWATMDLVDPTPPGNMIHDMQGAEPFMLTRMHDCDDKDDVGVSDFVGVRRHFSD